MNTVSYQTANTSPAKIHQTALTGAGWDNRIHQNNGNVALGDGSVQQLSSAALRNQLKNSGDASNLVVIPGGA